MSSSPPPKAVKNQFQRPKSLFLVALASVFVYRFRDLVTRPRTYPVPPMLASVSEEQASWPHYGRDAGGTRHSPLTEVHRNNVGQLKVAWIYHTGEGGSASPLRKKSAFEATPLMVDGALYLSTPFSRVISLDARTGGQRWVYDPSVDLQPDYSEVTSRGVSTWLDAERKLGRRIFVATLEHSPCLKQTARDICLPVTTSQATTPLLTMMIKMNRNQKMIPSTPNSSVR